MACSDGTRTTSSSGGRDSSAPPSTPSLPDVIDKLRQRPETQATRRLGAEPDLDDDITLQNLVQLEEETGAGPGGALDRVRRAVWEMLYADDAGVVSRSAEGLARMMTVIVEVLGEFGLTVSEKKTATLVMHVRETRKPLPLPPSPLTIEAAGQRYAQTFKLQYLGGIFHEHTDLALALEIFRSKAAWASMRKIAQELFDRPGSPFRLKIRLFQAEAMEALLYGCMTWAPRNEHYQLLRTTHHRLLWIPAQGGYVPAAPLRQGP